MEFAAYQNLQKDHGKKKAAQMMLSIGWSPKKVASMERKANES